MSEEPPKHTTPKDSMSHLKHVEIDEVLGSKRAKKSLWQRIGASGLSVSIIFHGILVFVAAAFVVSTVTENAKKESQAFVPGVGGGQRGERVKSNQHKVKPKNVKTLAKSTARITTKSPSASIALAEATNAPSVNSLLAGGSMGGDLSKGFGSGAGGGIGSGKGIGVGGGKNFVSKPVMGIDIFSQRLAVYFDASASMLEYLDRVEVEIRKKFPDADVFLSDGVFIDVHDNEVVGGEKFKGQPFLNRPTDSANKKNPKTGELVPAVTDANKLTSHGKDLYKKYGNNFKRGSVGAWLDILKDDKTYDGVFIFSDFEDGVRQIRTKAVGNVPAYKPDKGMRADPPVVFSERNAQGFGMLRSVTLIANGGASGQPVVQCKDTTGLIVGMVALGSGIPAGTTVTEIKDNVSFTLSKPLTALATGRVTCNNGGDKRFPEEKKWEDEWVKTFATARDGKAPRLYLVSISKSYGNKPGTILERCVAASEGSAIMIKFGNGKKGSNALTDLKKNYDDIYVGMPVSGRGVPKGATVVSLPTNKEIIDPEDPEKKRKKKVPDKPLTISAPLTEDALDEVFTFTPLIQAVGTLAKDSKTIEDITASVDIKVGMSILDGRFPSDATIEKVVPNKLNPGFFTVEMSAPANATAANAVLRFRPPNKSVGARGAAPVR